MAEKVTRRDFIRRSAVTAAGAGVVLAPAPVPARSVGASDRVRVGFIGTGSMGRSNLRDFLKQPEVEVVALCDVYEPSLTEALKLTEGKGETSRDFRPLLDRKDIDALVVSTPDHWHALQTILACQAGKDVYVEKPASVTIEEGRKMVEAARKYSRIVQLGTQQRSSLHIGRAVQLIQEGIIGKVSFVRTWNYMNQHPEGIGNPPDEDPPKNLDWDLWLGPAPKVPYNVNRFGILPGRWATFRYFWDYAGGFMTDWGVHLLDTVQWAMQVEAPRAVTASGGKFYLQDNRDTPDTLQATFEYPGWVCVYENRLANSNPANDKGYGVEFHGTEGTLFVDRAEFQVHPEKRRVGDQELDRMETIHMKRANSSHLDHVRDFLDSVQSRKLPRSDIEIGHRSTTACHLGNVAFRSRQRVVWDAGKEAIIEGGAEASKYLSRAYRKPWNLAV